MKNNIKKAFVTVGLILIFVFILTGCKNEGVTEAVKESARKTEDAVLAMKLQYQDVGFWEVAEKEAELIEDTIEKKPCFVDFIVSVDDKALVLRTSEHRLMFNNDSSRAEVANNMLIELANSEDVKSAHENGKEVAIKGIILKWIDKEGFLGSHDVWYSAADTNGDGQWNYASRGEIIYSEEEILKSETAPLYLHTIEDDVEIIDIQGKEGSFSDIQQLAQPAD